MPEAGATVLDRIKYLYTISHRTQASFSKLINIDPSSMSKILAGKMPITEQFVNRVVINLGVSKRWLLSGDGVPFEKAETLKEVDGVVASSVPKGAPVYDIDVTAGCTPLTSMFAGASILGYIDMPSINPGNPVVKVSGDSMEPRIHDGAFVSIRPIRDHSVIAWGSIYVVELEDYRLVKAVRKCHDDPSKIILHSFNDAYDDIEVDRRAVLRLYLVEAIINYQALA